MASSSHALPPIATPALEAVLDGSETRWTASPDARAVRTDDYLVVLDLRSGHYLSFNATGAIVWDHLERGATLSHIARDLSNRFSIPLERAAADVGRVVEAMEQGGLAAPESVFPGRASVPRGAPGNAALAAPLARRLLAIPEEERPRAGLLQLLGALVQLARFDVEMRLFGLSRLYRRITSKDETPPAPPDSASIWRLIDAADRAAALYFKQAWCLQRSAACAFLLRRRGVPARLTIGVHPAPFFAHAWVEIDGQAMNEKDESLLGMLTVIDRC